MSTTGGRRHLGRRAGGTAPRLTPRLTLRRYVSVSDVEDGMVLLDERKGRYFKLNASGALILRVLLDGDSPADAVRVLMARYQVLEERAAADVAALTAELADNGLVVA